ncbi:YncE family protein [Gemmatimonas aurantiaca]|nr:YncE family protein [Gemmatimonas aurantiaca]
MPSDICTRKLLSRTPGLTRSARVFVAGVACFSTMGVLATDLAAQAQPAAVRAPAAPTKNYWVYVGAESADHIYRVRFGPTGAAVEKAIPIGELAAEMEGPHGLQISADGKYLYMTTGHGTPDGKYWKYELGPDTLVGPGVSLGNFPASIDVTPDGLYALSVNFNLHGDMIPSSVSVVYTPNGTEVARIVTCTMPHGSRVSLDGNHQYSTCMMDDQLVEVDTRAFEVSRRFSLAKGKEGPLPLTAGTMAGMNHGAMDHSAHAAGGAAPAVKPAGPVIDPAQVGRAGMGMEKHDMSTPASCSPTWAQPSAKGDKIFVACNKADEILEVDTKEWTLTRRIKTGRGVYNLAVTADGALMVATLKQGNAVEIYDLATGASVGVVPTSNRLAHGVTLSPDSRYAFVSSEGQGAQPGKVDVIDLQARAKVGTVDVGQQASGITFWKMSN